jgi:hypothetical protein
VLLAVHGTTVEHSHISRIISKRGRHQGTAFPKSTLDVNDRDTFAPPALTRSACPGNQLIGGSFRVDSGGSSSRRDDLVDYFRGGGRSSTQPTATGSWMISPDSLAAARSVLPVNK